MSDRHEKEKSKRVRTAGVESAQTDWVDLIERVPLAIYTTTTDKAGTVQFVSPQVMALLGFEADAVDSPQELLHGQIHPDDRASVLTELKQANDTGTIFYSEYRMKNAEDEVIWVRDRAEIVDGKNGEDPHRFGVISDITEKKHTEFVLIENEIRYRDLVENMSEGVAVYSVVGEAEDFILKEFNRAAELITGFTRDQVIGKKVEEVFPGVRDLGLIDIFVKVWRTGQMQHQAVNEYRDERISLWVDNYVFKLVSGEIVAVFEDVTEKTRIENALKVSDERLRSAQAYAHLRYWELMNDGESAIWSDEVFRIFGTDDSMPVGPEILRKLIDPRDRNKVLESLKKSLSEGVEHHIDYRIQRPDGQERWVECRGKAIIGVDGRIEKLKGFIQDITERKQAEYDLWEAKNLAEQANSAKSRFLAAASHDLRQPLQALSLLISALSIRPIDQTGEQIVDDMKSALHVMENLLNSLLDISKLEARFFVPDRKDFEASVFLQNLRNQFRAQAEKKGIRIRLFPSDVILHTDINLLGRIVQNFIANAIYHSHGDRILIGCRRAGKNRRIEVWDRGPGIPEEHLDQIFEEFFQLGNPSRDLHRGLGLGLAIAKRVADLLQLKLNVRSRLGKGSVFSIEIPVGTESVCEIEKRSTQPEAGGLQNGLILVVEDDTTVLKATKCLLDQWGFSSSCVATAEEALHLISRGEQDFIVALLDYRLPNGWNGVKLFSAIRDRLGRELPSILLTGDTSVDKLREVREIGLPILHKPIDTSELYQMIREKALRPD